MRGDDGAGFLEIAELERDGGADDRVLPFERDRQRAHPIPPVVVGALDEFAAGRCQVALERLVRRRTRGAPAGEHERRLAVDVARAARRSSGGSRCPRRNSGYGCCQASAARAACRSRWSGRIRMVMRGRPATGSMMRKSCGGRKTRPNWRKRGTKSVMRTLPPCAIGQHGRNDRRVAQIFGLILRHVVEHDVGEALLLLARQQSAEDRVAVEARIAPPDDPRARIDQCGRAPVADDGKIQPMVFHPAASP